MKWTFLSLFYEEIKSFQYQKKKNTVIGLQVWINIYSELDISQTYLYNLDNFNFIKEYIGRECRRNIFFEYRLIRQGNVLDILYTICLVDFID